jgi:hypothetical protein
LTAIPQPLTASIAALDKTSPMKPDQQRYAIKRINDALATKTKAMPS